MKKWLWVLFLAGGCASGGDDGTLVGRVRFVDVNGQPAGDASLFQVDEGVRIIASFPNLGGGDHGFHFHSVGECRWPTFETAGPHFNPTQRQHGRLNPNGPHAGDLPNVDRGRTMVNMVAQGLQMTGPNGLDDANGSALILHANLDDQKTDPSGNSGARIRCGVVERP
jgi:superoxide dismutase, Cu-Zn family